LFRSILTHLQILQDTKIDANFVVEELAARTEGFSGSDLKELCRNAAMVPVRELMQNSEWDHEALEKGKLEVRY